MRKLLIAIGLVIAIATSVSAQVNVTPIADVTVGATATLVKAGNAFREALNCTIHGTIAVRWGDSTVTATNGQRIPANNSTAEIKSRGAIYMISEGANVTVSCTEETK